MCKSWTYHVYVTYSMYLKMAKNLIRILSTFCGIRKIGASGQRYSKILYDITPPHAKPFWAFISVRQMFFPYFFIHRTLHAGKIYPVKKIIKKILLKSENYFFCLGKVGFLLHFTPLVVNTGKKHVMWKNFYLFRFFLYWVYERKV